ncbi:hydantoinase/oxoprolinase family protein, partial [Candidatus Bipolaricaulota bacterium]|nr:hydantoinase/oxoprolinase family protein [Candidatus Bipolaricaulota bacterium]
LVMLGWRPERGEEFPRCRKSYVPGRFNAKGEVVEPLDEEMVLSLLEDWEDEVVGYAVSGYFSVRNPRHEEKVEELIAERTEKPVIAGHELSRKLGFYERSVTAVLNVKVIPIIESFIEGTRQALTRRGIDAPLMMVKSDGSLSRSSEVKKKPIETIFSGPAASAIGARWLSGKDNGVVVDIGGTTVDIAVLDNGLPELATSGVQVGEWKTKVQSMDLRSVGLGGDSRIKLDKEGRVVFGPETSKPLAFGDLSDSKLNRIEFYEDTSFIEKTKAKASELESLNEMAVKLFRLVGEEPVNRTKLFNLARETNIVRAGFYLEELEKQGFLRRVALTPTDLLHVIGEYTGGTVEAPRTGAEVLSRKSETEPRQFANAVKSAFEKEIALEIVKKYVLKEEPDCDFNQNPLWNYLTKKEPGDLTVNFELNSPLIGIGAPAGVFLPSAAEKVGADFIEVENYSVGNAVGAVTGQVTKRVEVLVAEQPEREQYVAFLPNEKKVMDETHEEEVLVEATEHAKNSARKLVIKSGGTNPDISVKEEPFDHGRTKIEVIAVSDPELSRTDKFD